MHGRALRLLFFAVFLFAIHAQVFAQSQTNVSPNLKSAAKGISSSAAGAHSSGATSSAFNAPADASFGKIGEFMVTGTNLERNLEKNTIVIEGNVQIIYQNQHMKADFVEINERLRQAYFRGNVQIVSPEFEIGGDEIKLDYQAEQSIIVNGYVKSASVRFQGKFIEQLGPKEFYVVDADYTTCTNCPETWSFEATQIKAELGGYAFLKNTFLKVVDVPVFWLPYLVVPLKNERQTGLLAPEIAYIRNRRLVFTQSLFWAASRSQDVTFTFKNYELGGLKKLVEYRYAVTDDSFGQVNVAHLNDTVFKSEDRFNFFRQTNEKEQDFQRWSVKSYQQYTFSDSGKLRLKLDQVSDLQYPKDFFDEYLNYADSGLENRLSYTKSLDHVTFNADAMYYQHLLQANPTASNEVAVHRLPELSFDSTLKKMGDLPLYYKFKTRYTNFYREKKYDDISTDSEGQKYVSNYANNPSCENVLSSNNCGLVDDGVFNANNDLIRTGQRVNIKGTIATDTYTLGSAVNISPQISYNEAHYFFPVGDERSNIRRFAQLDVLSRSKLFNVYSTDPEGPGKIITRYKHEFIPELQYVWIPWVDQTSNEFFGASKNGEAPFSSKYNLGDADIGNQNGIQFDYDDRIYDQHLITLSLLNRVIRKKTNDQSYRNLLDFRLTQSYDVYQASGSGANKGQPLSDLSGTLTLNLDYFTLTNQFNYYPYLSATDSSTSLSHLNEQQQYFKIGYISKRTGGLKQDDVSLALGFVTAHLNLLTGVIVDTSENRQSDNRLKKFSLIAQIKPPGECWAVNFYRDQKVGVEAEWRVRFDFSFDGKPPKVIPPAELAIN